MATADGTGINPSVTPENAPKLVNFIARHTPHKERPLRIVDVGCGLGHLVNEFNTRGLYRALGYEGNSELVSYSVTDQVTKFVVGRDEISDRFDLSISIEVAEHVEPCNQPAFWDSIRKLAPFHFCSIHVGKSDRELPEEDLAVENYLHQSIFSEDDWLDFLYGMGAANITEFQRACTFPSDWAFHTETQIGWEKSFIILIEWAI